MYISTKTKLHHEIIGSFKIIDDTNYLYCLSKVNNIVKTYGSYNHDIIAYAIKTMIKIIIAEMIDADIIH